MIKFKIVPEGSEDWLPKDWENYYKSVKRMEDHTPLIVAKLMHKGLEYTRRVIVTKYLTGPRPKRLAVDTGRARASVNYKVNMVNKDSVQGEIGTDYWVLWWWEEGVEQGAYPTEAQRSFFWAKYYASKGKKSVGGESGVQSALKWKRMALVDRFKAKPWLEPGVEESEDYIDRLFQKVGLHLERIADGS